MLRFLVLVMFVMVFAPQVLAAPLNVGKDEIGYYASGRILVKAKPGLDEKRFKSIVAERGGIDDLSIPSINVRIVKVPPGQEKKIAAELRDHPSVKFSELDRLVSPNFVPNDPSLSSQWHLAKIKATSAWDTSKADNVVIAILDTGVSETHPDLAGKLLLGRNVVSANSDISDVYGHGTGVAGAAAATTNNSVGVSGVGFNARILPVKITNDTSTGSAYYSDMAAGIVWAADNGADIANLSYQSVAGSSTVNSAAQYLNGKGGILFVAAGNTGANQTYVNYPSIIAVSATDSYDNRAGWSDYGDFIDVAAPGVSILTTVPGGGYGAWSGTSFASPVAAGVAALVLGVNPSLGPGDVEKILEETAFDPTNTGISANFGHGRVDAFAAVNMATTFVPTVNDSTAPTVKITSPASGLTVNGIIAVDVSASDNIGVSKVDLYVNGAFYASDTEVPYSFSWDTTPLGNAAGNLVAYAYDARGNKGTAPVISVNVRNIVDTTPPVVTILSPLNGARVISGNVSIKATAVDNTAVDKMVLFINGRQKASVNGASLSYNWNTKKEKVGTHTITVEAWDSSNNKSQSIIQVTR